MIYADLHVHSKYSRATSRDADLEHSAVWARKKGLTVVATGDFTHPKWLQELKEKLVPAEPGLFRLRDDLQRAVDAETPAACRGPVRFVLQVEISTIYKKGDRTRKVHHVVYVPGFREADALVAALSRIGNLASDGRPILGLDSRHLLEIVLECGDGCYLVPAHVWTPWFALFGSQSGFDAVEECYGDLSDHIFALETGLSSDPPMNWRWSALDRYALVSNSDAHSPAKLAREACVFDTPLDYFALFRALQTRDGYRGTVEFFPEEGKYHLDGHRKCGVRLTPAETRQHNGLCPECGKRVTVGVMHRVEELADRPEGTRPEQASPFRSFIPLPEVIAELRGVGEKTKAVQQQYEKVLQQVGPELDVLEHVPVETLRREGFGLLAEAIDRMRRGEVFREAGFDGQYGVIRVFPPGEVPTDSSARALFARPADTSTSRPVRDTESTEPTGSTRAAAAGADAGRAQPARAKQPAPTRQTDGTATSGSSDPLARQSSDVRALRVAEGPPADGLGQAAPRSDTSRTGERPWRGEPLDAGASCRSEPAQQRSPGASEEPTSAATEPSQADGLSSSRGVRSLFDFDQSADDAAASARLLVGLDADQRQAVCHRGGPLAILAGPGTGKTRTLAHRVAALVVDELAEPEQCLTLTFSRRATAEMKERIGRLVPDVAERIPVLTFHALGLQILRERFELLGLADRFRVAADAERLELARSGWGVSEREARRRLKRVSLLKRAGVGGAFDFEPAGSPPDEVHAVSSSPEELRWLAEYDQMLRRRGLVDFDDLILLPVRLLTERPELVEQYRSRWPWVSVDEFQDTDAAQYELLRLLAPTDGNVCVIGDPDQSIYGFRGADARVFERFLRDYPTARVVHLRTNYRSSPAITQTALCAIEPSSLVPGRTLRSVLEQSEPVRVRACASDRAEAEFVVHTIERLIGGHAFFSLDSGRVDHALGDDQPYSFDDFAVLYRTEAQAEPLVEAFRRSGLPFQVRSHRPLVDDERVRRLVSRMHELLQAATDGKPSSSLETEQQPAQPDSAVQLLNWALDTLADSAVVAEAERPGGEGEQPDPLDSTVEDLHRLAVRFGEDVVGYLNELAVVTHADLWDPRANRVSLLTLHAAKGLEFRVVFLVGCEDGLLPLKWGESLDAATLDEERRLLFVGMTRARERLFVTYARRRLWRGKVRPARVSSFLDEPLTLESVQLLQPEHRPKKARREKQLRLFD